MLQIKAKRKMTILTVVIFSFLFSPFNVANAFIKKKPKVYTPESQYKYEQKVLRKNEEENYKRSLLPESGYMTREEYEKKSKDITNAQRSIPEYKLPRNIKMEYIPQPTYKLVRYNNPPGSPELKLGRPLKFDRRAICPGVTSPNRDILVYPVVNYYAEDDCTSGQIFVVPLDKSLPDVERIKRANIIKQNPNPILSTSNEVKEKFAFRTMTPIDFSPDGTKLIAKEKIGYTKDGIWKTNLWVYDFTTGHAREIPEIREAIKYYWAKAEGINLEEKRWDIYPMGFSQANPDRIVVTAYGYTGKRPKFLGAWSVDTNGERSMLISLFKVDMTIASSGFKLEQDGVVNPAVVYNENKRQDNLIKKQRKAELKAKKNAKKLKKKELKTKLKQMKQEEKEVLKQYKQRKKIVAPTGMD